MVKVVTQVIPESAVSLVTQDFLGIVELRALVELQASQASLVSVAIPESLVSLVKMD